MVFNGPLEREFYYLHYLITRLVIFCFRIYRKLILLNPFVLNFFHPGYHWFTGNQRISKNK